METMTVWEKLFEREYKSGKIMNEVQQWQF